MPAATARSRKAPAAKADVLLDIAKTHLFLETLETRKGGSLDFAEQAVWSIKAALEAAYEAGYKAGATAR